MKQGDTVSWNTPQGKTHGKVTKKVSTDKFEVKSTKSGKKAQHKQASLNEE